MQIRRLVPIYAASLFLSLHYAVLIYINSSYLGTFVPEKVIGILYAAAALINIFLFLNAARILRRISLRKLFFTFAFIDLAAIIGMGFATNAALACLLFVLFNASELGLFFCLDIFLESRSQDESTGRIRSGYLTIIALAVLCSPLLSGFVVGSNHYERAYFTSALFLIIMIAIAFVALRDTVHPSRHLGTMVENVRLFWKESALRRIFGANFLLQFFYAWMVVYMPIYLHEYLGFEWQTIGLLFTIMLLPFVLFEIPVGRIADKVLGEKEILITGFAFLAVFTAVIPFIANSPIQFTVWAFVLFMTRVGASFVEVTTESYFWKHVSAKQSGFIGIFRLTVPLAFTLGPIAAIATLSLIPFQFMFLILAGILLLGFPITFALKDTR